MDFFFKPIFFPQEQDIENLFNIELFMGYFRELVIDFI